MGKMQRDKGARVEREIVQRFIDIGLHAEKVPLSGAAGGSFSGDLLVDGRRVEVKSRKDGTGFKLLYRWLGDNDWLVLKQDRSEPLVVMTIQALGSLISKDLEYLCKKILENPNAKAKDIMEEWSDELYYGRDVVPPYPNERPRPANHPPEEEK